MKISICIPQFNRIEYLKINLQHIAQQKNAEIEVIVSDDASTDDTYLQIPEIQKNYPFPLTYFRFEKNEGYDRNLRKSLELATGDYCFILGNDDALTHEMVISELTDFLINHDYPEIGFCNSADYVNKDEVQIRAQNSSVIGRGPQTALKYYSSFSFVAGIIVKRESFEEVNTSKFDKSIYVQIYLATLIIIKGGRLFSIKEPLILKDIRVNNEIANSYLDTLPRLQSEYKILDAGLPSYAYVSAMAFKDAGLNDNTYYYHIIKRIYLFTYPFWLIDYRKHHARVAARGLKNGLTLKSFKQTDQLSTLNKIKLNFYYKISTILGLYVPVIIFNALHKTLYKIAKS